MSDGRTRRGSPSIVRNNGMRWSAPPALLAFAIVSATLVLAVAPGLAVAQESPGETLAKKKSAALDCGDFATQRGAQAIFERSPVASSAEGGDPFALDEDADGKACETSSPGGTAEDGTKLGSQDGDDLDCVDLPSQEAAQARLKANPSDPHDLDLDNNGVACEIVPVLYENPAEDHEPVVAARSKADLDCKDFEYQQEAQTVYLLNPSDPNGLDGPNEPAEKDKAFIGNGVACETLPSLASNEVQMVGMDAGTVDANAPAPALVGLVAAWPYGGNDLGLLLDLTALLLVACGVWILVVVLRARRSSSGGPA